MFRMDPQYIVAGEIVRTTRMYAMSVSPLSRSALEKINPTLFASFGGRGGKEREKEGAPGERLKKARDFTNNIKIGSEVFAIETVKGKKQVTLPWEKLARLEGEIPTESVYRALRGTILIDGKYTLLAGEKLELILSLIPTLDIAGALKRTWPRKETFNSTGDLAALLPRLKDLVEPALWKAGKKELGFVCLFTDGEGNYWFKCSRGFHTGLNESLATVETLIDELGEEVDVEIKHVVNQTYRRLSDYLG
jgi:hypothetical protein